MRVEERRVEGSGAGGEMESSGERAEGAGGKVHQTYWKINRFPKNPSPVGGIPRIRFLTHMAVIKDKQSPLEMAWAPG